MRSFVVEPSEEVSSDLTLVVCVANFNIMRSMKRLGKQDQLNSDRGGYCKGREGKGRERKKTDER